MKFTIVGRKFDVKDDLKNYIQKKVSKIDKFFGEETEAHVTVKQQKNTCILEVTINYKGVIFRAQEESAENHKYCVDKCVDTIERQIRKNKTRLEKKMRSNTFSHYHEDMPHVEEETEFKIVKTKQFAVKPMSIEEAILQMNLLRHQFFMFLDSSTQKVNVVYKRNDGDYGLIEPIFE